MSTETLLERLVAGCLAEPRLVQRKYLQDAKKTILVLEADVALLDTIVHTLRGAGYEILTAHTGPAAALICERSAMTIDLILSDFSLPGGNSTKLAEKLIMLRPDLPIIFMAGNRKTSHALRTQGFIVLQKPLSFAEMVCVIREILGGPTTVTTIRKATEISSTQ